MRNSQYGAGETYAMRLSDERARMRARRYSAHLAQPGSPCLMRPPGTWSDKIDAGVRAVTGSKHVCEPTEAHYHFAPGEGGAKAAIKRITGSHKGAKIRVAELAELSAGRVENEGENTLVIDLNGATLETLHLAPCKEAAPGAAWNKVMVVGSVESSAVDGGANWVTRVIKEAAAGRVKAAGKPGAHESPFEEEVGRTLAGWGYNILYQPQCGNTRIDIGILAENNQKAGYGIGIECDGARWHSGSSARTWDQDREQTLRAMGWTLHRIWGPSWRFERNEEETKLRKALEENLPGWSGK